MMQMVGTASEMVKLASMNSKIQWKKDNSVVANEDMTPEERMLKQYQEDLEQMRQNQQMSDIELKMQSGAKLTREELEYLKRTNPERYQDYEEMKREKEAYEKQLKNCKTKEDVDRCRMVKMGEFAGEFKNISQNPRIPKGKKIEMYKKLMMRMSNVEAAHNQFVETKRYEELPTETDIQAEAEAVAEEKAAFSEEAREAAEKARYQEELENAKKNADAMGEAFADLGKILEIARRISNGDRVPGSDEQKLMEYSNEMYQAAKSAAALKKHRDAKEYEALFEDEPEGEASVQSEGDVSIDAGNLAPSAAAPQGTVSIDVGV